MSLGATLKAARETRGLTAEDIADQTHIFIQVIEKLEADDFSRIPAPVYGRGFIKHYAECVGLDPEPLVAEFMEAYTGKKATPHVKPAAVAKAPPPPQEEEPEAQPPEAVEPPPVNDILPPQEAEAPEMAPEPQFEQQEIPPSAIDLPLFSPQPPPPPRPAAVSAPMRGSEPQSRAGVFSSRWSDEGEEPGQMREKPKRAKHNFRKAVTSASHSIFSNMGRLAAQSQRIPPAFWRYLLLGLGGLLLIFGLVRGCKALYNLTETKDEPKTEEVAQATAETKTSEAAATEAAAVNAPIPDGKLRSTGETVPSLYVD